MKKLNSLLDKVAYKKLALVECDPETSNQREFNGVSSLKDIFGTVEDNEKKHFDCRFIMMSDTDGVFEDNSQLTWYDARSSHPVRSEYRLYYKHNIVMSKSKKNDLIVFLMYEERFLAIVCEEGSSYESQIAYLFNINGSLNLNTFSISSDDDFKVEVDFTRRRILEEIGLEEDYFDDKSCLFLEEMLQKFDGSFPSTKKFSDFARNTLGCEYFNDLKEDMDTCIIGWIEREEALFYALEKHFVSKKLKNGFDGVDDFIKYSLSVQNRRKSRVGYSLENHLEEIFMRKEIDYSRGKITEAKSRPDFIFPSIEKYKDQNYATMKLKMLGVKSTCKDRWRQILSEAKRISHKHLFTLEASISLNQTNEMKSNNVKLVIPKSIHKTYNSNQERELLGLNDFISILKNIC